MPTSCKIARSSTLQFPNGDILNHRIIVASFEEKGSTQEKPCILQGFFIGY